MDDDLRIAMEAIRETAFVHHQDGTFVVDGHFTLAELEAILAWARAAVTVT